MPGLLVPYCTTELLRWPYRADGIFLDCTHRMGYTHFLFLVPIVYLTLATDSFVFLTYGGKRRADTVDHFRCTG